MIIDKEFKKVKPKESREKSLENKVKKDLKNRNVFFYKSFGSSFQIRGLPDIICCINGLFVGFEIKRKSGKPQVSQIICGSQILKSNGIYIIVDDFDEYLKYIECIQDNDIDKLFEYLEYNDCVSFLNYIFKKYKLKVEDV